MRLNEIVQPFDADTSAYEAKIKAMAEATARQFEQVNRELNAMAEKATGSANKSVNAAQKSAEKAAKAANDAFTQMTEAAASMQAQVQEAAKVTESVMTPKSSKKKNEVAAWFNECENAARLYGGVVVNLTQEMDGLQKMEHKLLNQRQQGVYNAMRTRSTHLHSVSAPVDPRDSQPWNTRRDSDGRILPPPLSPPQPPSTPIGYSGGFTEYRGKLVPKGFWGESIMDKVRNEWVNSTFQMTPVRDYLPSSSSSSSNKSNSRTSGPYDNFIDKVIASGGSPDDVVANLTNFGLTKTAAQGILKGYFNRQKANAASATAASASPASSFGGVPPVSAFDLMGGYFGNYPPAPPIDLPSPVPISSGPNVQGIPFPQGTSRNSPTAAAYYQRIGGPVPLDSNSNPNSSNNKVWSPDPTQHGPFAGPKPIVSSIPPPMGFQNIQPPVPVTDPFPFRGNSYSNGNTSSPIPTKIPSPIPTIPFPGAINYNSNPNSPNNKAWTPDPTRHAPFAHSRPAFIDKPRAIPTKQVYDPFTKMFTGYTQRDELDEIEYIVRDSQRRRGASFGSQAFSKMSSGAMGGMGGALNMNIPMGPMRAFTGLLSDVGSQFSRLASSINPISPLLEVMSSRFIKIAAVMAGIGLATAAINTGLTRAMDYQDAVSSLGAMTGNKEFGKKLVDQVQEYSTNSPFRQQDLLQNVRTLKGFGVEDENLLPATKAIGAITAGAGGGEERFQRISLAFGQVVSKGFLKGEEVRQFANAGVGVRDFADALDITTPKLIKMMKLGQVESSVLYTAFNKLTSETGRYGKVIDELNQNARGRLNIIENKFGLGLQNAGLKFLEAINQAGVFDKVEGWADQFTKVTAEMSTWTDVGQGFKAFLVAVEVAMKSIYDIVTQVSAAFGTLFDESGLTTIENVMGMIAAIPSAMKDGFLYVKAILYEIKATAYGLAKDFKPLLSKLGIDFDDTPRRKATEEAESFMQTALMNTKEPEKLRKALKDGDMKTIREMAPDLAGAIVRAQKAPGAFDFDAAASDALNKSNEYYGLAGTNTMKALDGYFSGLKQSKFKKPNTKSGPLPFDETKGIFPPDESGDPNQLRPRRKSTMADDIANFYEKVYGADDKNYQFASDQKTLNKSIELLVKGSQGWYEGNKFKQLGNDQIADGIGAINKDLRDKYKDHIESMRKQPEAAYTGSVEARDAVNAAKSRQDGNKTEFEEMLEFIKLGHEIEVENKRRDDETSRLFKEWVARGGLALLTGKVRGD